MLSLLCSIAENNLEVQGAKYLSEALAVNKALAKLEYAACLLALTVIPP